MPLAVGILAYSAAWLTGLVKFEGSAGAPLVGLVSAATWITIFNSVLVTGRR